ANSGSPTQTAAPSEGRPCHHDPHPEYPRCPADRGALTVTRRRELALLSRVGRVPDNIFEHPRLTAIYDALDPDRSDLEVYIDIAAELGATRLLDVGCGTGTYAFLLAEHG